MHPLLSSVFSDETSDYLTPAEPDPGDDVCIRIRVPLDTDAVMLVADDHEMPMQCTERAGCFSRYELHVRCGDRTFSYYFRITVCGQTVIYLKDGAHFSDPALSPDPLLRFRFTPGFHTPRWARGAVQYQIVPDRFFNGDPANDVVTSEYSYAGVHVRQITDWDAPPPPDGYRCFYGGDLAGILQKLDYLQSLGVEVLYLNPVFLSPSSHKYDTQSYDHIDPHLGIIAEDADHTMADWEHHNGYAVKYLKRVLSEENLAQSDTLFARLCGELHKRGMRIILDGVFNHCGSFHMWMDREGVYRNKPGYLPGAYQNISSPYRDRFRFEDTPAGYEAWWGVETLPKLNFEASPPLCEEIFSVAEKWLRPPYSIDGWRLDVAADLGHSQAFNHLFWREFRNRVKAVNPEALLIAEHYGDPSSWLQGDQWDTVMNYDAFMDPLSFFLTGMEKHSDGRNDELYNNGPAFFSSMRKNMASFQQPSLSCAMNELSNHDHSRFLTRTNRQIGRMETKGCYAADENICKPVFRIAAVVQMTWPGSPTVYYGDEAGQTGWTDPDNRRTYPWGHEDRELISLHRELARIRREHPVLREGSFVPLYAEGGTIAFARFDQRDCVVVACNNTERETDLTLRLKNAGIPEGTILHCIVSTGIKGHTDGHEIPDLISDGDITHLRLSPLTSVIFA